MPFNAAVITFIRNAPSLRWRMSFWTTVVCVTILGGLGAFLYGQVSRTTDAVLTERLVGRAQLIASGLSGLGAVTDEQLSRIATGPMAAGGPESFAVGVYGADGALVAATQRPMPWAWAAEEGPRPLVERRRVTGLGAESRGGSGSGAGAAAMARVLVRTVTDGPGRTLVIVSDDGQYEAVLSGTRSRLLLAFLIGAAATMTATWVISGVSLRPLSRLAPIASSFAPEAIRAGPSAVAVPAELAEFQRELSAARERLSESFRAQDRLISNVSHELKTPIAVLLTEAETIELDTLPPDGVRFVRSVREEMRRLGGMIESFLVLSRLRGGGTIPAARVCSVNDVLLEAVGGCNAAAQRRGVTIRADAAADADPPMVHGDAELLASMFGHVIRNCIRFSNRGDEIEVSASTREGGCCISIADAGSSIPEPVRLRLFDRFIDEKDHCENRRELGLQVAQGVAELHGGRISALNREPSGCVFTIDLPLAGGGAGAP